MILLLSAHSDPSKIAITVLQTKLLRGSLLLRSPMAWTHMEKREGQVASRGLFQPMFPCDSDIKTTPWK